MNKSFLIVVSVCFSLLLFAGSVFAAEPEFVCATKDFNSNEKNKNVNGRDPGEWVTWQIKAEVGSWVEFIFDSKEPGGAPESPFWDGQLSWVVDMDKPTKMETRGPVKSDAKGSYHYKIVCHPKEGAVQTIDPIIEVPKPS